MLEVHLAELLARSGLERASEIAREIWLLSEGAISLILVHGDRSYAAAAAQAAHALIDRAGVPRARPRPRRKPR